MAEEKKQTEQHRCYWCGKPAPYKHQLVKDNSTSEQQPDIYLCRFHHQEMEGFRRKRVGGEL